MQDIFRLFLALAVVLFHFRHFAEERPLTATPEGFAPPFDSFLDPFYTYGYHSVTVFFFLSGFMLGSKNLGENKFSPYIFLRSRLARIYPAHICSLTFLLLLSVLATKSFGQPLFMTDDISLAKLLESLLLMQGLGLTQGLNVSFNLPVWSLSVELICYCMFATICMAKRSLRIHLFVLMVVVSAIIKSQTTNASIGNVSNGLIFFFAGTLFSIKAPKSHIDREYCIQKSLITILALTSVAVAGWAISFKVNLGMQKFLWLTTVFPAAIFAISHADSLISRLTKKTRPFEYLGLLSFSLYIWHFPMQTLIYYAIKLSSFDEHDQWYNSSLLLLSYLLLSITAAHLSLVTVEKSGSAFIKGDKPT